jgi:fatty-acyl-CoA synthase
MSFTRHVADTFELVTDLVPDQSAIIQGDHEVLWRDFDNRAARLASALDHHGIVRGDVVAIAMYNCPEWLEAFYGILKQRAIPANINYRYLADEMYHLLADCKAVAVIFHSSLANVVLSLQDRLPLVRLWVVVDDLVPADSGPALHYESLLAEHPPAARQARPDDE